MGREYPNGFRVRVSNVLDQLAETILSCRTLGEPKVRFGLRLLNSDGSFNRNYNGCNVVARYGDYQPIVMVYGDCKLAFMVAEALKGYGMRCHRFNRDVMHEIDRAYFYGSDAKCSGASMV